MNEIEKLLICLRIKGFGKTEPLAAALGVASEEIVRALDDLKSAGEAEDTRVGARLTAAGKARADAVLTAEREGVDKAAIAAEIERFNPVNLAFKHLMTRWQMREVDGKPVRNDHSDAQYDADVTRGFAGVHDQIGEILGAVQASVARYADYRKRLDRAWDKVQAGDIRYLAAPDLESYHTIWFELHQDLIGLSGTTRAKEAAAGRAH